MQILLAAVSRSGGSPEIARRAAQHLARRELARSIYQPDLLQRFLRWLGSLFRGTTTVLGGGPAAVIALTVLAVLALAGLLYLTHSPFARRRQHPGVLAGPSETQSAADHRQAAEHFAAAGNFSGAIVERVRAMAAGLEERGVLAPRPGRTAAEFAAEAALAMPASQADVRMAARLFDDVRYGEHAGTAAGYQHVRMTDEQLQARRPAQAGTAVLAGATPGPAPW